MPRTDLPPGPREPTAIQTLRFLTRPVPFLESCRRRYGGPFTIRLAGNVPFVVLTDPEHVKEFFAVAPDVLHPGEGGKVLGPIMGRHSVLLLDEDAHMEQRKLMLPAFHGEKMAALTGLLEEVTERAIASWPRDEEVALHPRLQAVTLEVILRAVFGFDEGARLDQMRTLLERYLIEGVHPAVMLPPLHWDLGPRSPWGRFSRTRAETLALLGREVAERRASGGESDDVLSMFLAAEHSDGSPMRDEEIVDELMTLLVAGHETTASSLSFACADLVRNPGVYDRLTAAIDAGEDEYLDATITEALRRRPVLPFSQPRLAVKPVEVGGRRYEPGVALTAGIYLIQHDPSIYPEPYAFRPERWLDQRPGTYTWLPFGGGRRRCLGASFAQLEMKVVLRELLRQTTLSSSAPPERTARRHITVTPERGARVTLRARAREREAVPA
ncbi:MAG: cytochrome P450 [Solirubrobacteraceae bacterium]|nr:cytochrome P450 [Solirubrobacteraceae bacterium]